MKTATPESAPAPLPMADDRDAIARTLWELTDREYRRATPAYAKVMTNNSVEAAEEDKSPDFSRGNRAGCRGSAARSHCIQPKGMGRKSPEIFGPLPEISRNLQLHGDAAIEQTTSYFVSSEGSKVETPRLVARLVVEADTRADDGMDLVRVETFESTTPKACLRKRN